MKFDFRTLPSLPLPEGEKSLSSALWPEVRAKILQILVPCQYGVAPALPLECRADLLNLSHVRAWPGVDYGQYRLRIPGLNFSFRLDIHFPRGKERAPVLLSGDGCWRYATDEVIAQVLSRGYALAQFSRVELAADVPGGAKHQGLYPCFPELDFGAVAAWAWGFSCAVSALQDLERIDAAKIAVLGHSRGGKAALLAGAVDERIALTWANNSGCGGAGSHRFAGEGAERLKDILENYAHWFPPGLAAYAGRDADLPFDQHWLKAAVAPRALLTTEAWGDRWANPEGTLATHRAAVEIFRTLGVEEKLGIFFREGPHDHRLEDWKVFLDFADGQFRGGVPPRRYKIPPDL